LQPGGFKLWVKLDSRTCTAPTDEHPARATSACTAAAKGASSLTFSAVLTAMRVRPGRLINRISGVPSA
jgi:hypothetical protein